MAAIGTLPVVLGTGVHGSRPAASAVGKGGLYACSTHALIYQTDGSSWTTWASLTAGASGPTYSDWTPTLTASSVNPTLGSGNDCDGRYFQDGNHVVADGYVVFGSSGVASGTGDYRILLPVTALTTSLPTAAVVGNGYVYDSSVGTFRTVSYGRLDSTHAQVLIDSGTAVAANNVPWTWAAGDALVFHFDYEAA